MGLEVLDPSHFEEERQEEKTLENQDEGHEGQARGPTWKEGQDPRRGGRAPVLGGVPGRPMIFFYMAL